MSTKMYVIYNTKENNFYNGYDNGTYGSGYPIYTDTPYVFLTKERVQKQVDALIKYDPVVIKEVTIE